MKAFKINYIDFTWTKKKIQRDSFRTWSFSFSSLKMNNACFLKKLMI